MAGISSANEIPKLPPLPPPAPRKAPEKHEAPANKPEPAKQAPPPPQPVHSSHKAEGPRLHNAHALVAPVKQDFSAPNRSNKATHGGTGKKVNVVG